MELLVKDSKGNLATADFPWEEMEAKLTAKLKELLSSEVKLADSMAHLEDVIKEKDARIAELESPEHEAEIVSQRAGSLTVDDWWRIGEQRGYASKPMTEAELAEEKVPEAELSEAEKPKEEQEGVLIEGTNIRIV